jgi:ribosomal protein S18 acetylase RimI-like enzyme
LGLRILDEATEIAVRKGKKALRLDALKSNLPAQKMYENTGMTDFLYYEKIPAEIWNRKDDRDEGSSDKNRFPCNRAD